MNTKEIEEQESKKELGTVDRREIRTLDMISGAEYVAMNDLEKYQCVIESTLRGLGIARPKDDNSA